MNRIEITRYIPDSLNVSLTKHSLEFSMVVYYHPFMRDLYLPDGYPLKFIYINDSYVSSEHAFQFDADPFGEGHPLDMLELSSNIGYSEMKFGIHEGDSDFYHFNIKSKYQQHTAIQKAIVEVNKKERKIEFKETDLDDVTIFFEKGKIISFRIKSSNSGGTENYRPFSIIRENGEYILIQYRPDFKRTKLQGFFLHNHLIRCTHEEGEFSYQLDINENIYNLVKELIDIEGSWDISALAGN